MLEKVPEVWFPTSNLESASVHAQSLKQLSLSLGRLIWANGSQGLTKVVW
jgi:hypothetical protein